jgi:putative transposase
VGLTREKKVNGRKRQILVDTLGLLLRVSVHEADISDAEGGEFVLVDLGTLKERLRKLWADQAYRGLVDWDQEEYGLDLEIVEKQTGQRGFVVLPRRWVVERTIAWLGRNRRLSKDYEFHCESSESMVYLSSIHLLLKRLAKPQ